MLHAVNKLNTSINVWIVLLLLKIKHHMININNAVNLHH
jgi:hypothetical protein